jgi:hypothetical protein
MADYSDLIFLMGAMILFSVLTVNVTRNMVINTQTLSESEIEYNGIAVAHSTLKRAQWASKEELTPGSGQYIFSDYEKQNPYKETIEVEGSDIDYYVYVNVSNDVGVTGSTTSNRLVEVGVTSPYLNEDFDSTFTDYPIKMEFINAFDE